MIEGIELATAGAKFADEKQAEEIMVLNLEGLSSITDYFVICTGSSLPHLRAIRNEIVDRFREDHELRPSSMEGQPESKWMVLDYGDVMFHIFHRDKREFYSLEDLWSDAPHEEWQGVVAEGG